MADNQLDLGFGDHAGLVQAARERSEKYPHTPTDLRTPSPKPVQDIREWQRKTAQEVHDEARRKASIGTGTSWANAFRAGTTGSLVRNALREDFVEDPEFLMDTDSYNALLSKYSLQHSEHNQNYLYRAISAEDADSRAALLEDTARIMGDLENHWGKSFFAGTFDPTEIAALSAVTLLTRGVGTPAYLASRAGRGVYAASNTAALLGTMRAAEHYGKETALTDYVLAGALSLPLSYWAAPRVARQDRQLDANGRPQERLEGPGAGSRVEPGQQGTPGRPGGQAAPEGTPGRRAARRQDGSPKRASAAETQRAFRTLADAELRALPSVRQRIDALTERLRILQRDRKSREELAASRAEPAQQELDLDGSASQGTPESVIDGGTHVSRREWEDAQAAKREAEVQQELDSLNRRADRAERYREELDELDRSGKLPDEWQQRLDAEQVQEVHDVGSAQEAARGLPQDTPTQPLPEAAAEALEGTLRRQRGLPGLLKAPFDAVKRAHRGFTEFVSEYEKLTGGLQVLQEYLARVIEDPLQRAGLVAQSAASRWRTNLAKANTDMREMEDLLKAVIAEEMGVSRFRQMGGYSRAFEQAVADLDKMLQEYMLRVNTAVENGLEVPPPPNNAVARIYNGYDKVTRNASRRYVESGAAGAEGMEHTPGYFHRSWAHSKIRRMQTEAGDGAPRELIIKAAMSEKGLGLELADARVLAAAILKRTKAKAGQQSSDFMGSLGNVETDGLRQLMIETGATPKQVDIIMSRIEQRTGEAGQVKYSRSRLKLDMTVKLRDANGKDWGMGDLIEGDMMRLLENYQRGLAGRGALAEVGIGRAAEGIEDSAQGITAYVDGFKRLVDKQDLPQRQKEQLYALMDHVIGEYTGVRPPGSVLGDLGQIGKNLANAGMLGALGILQLPETALIAANHGWMATTKAMLRQFPGIKGLLDRIGSDSNLLEEFNTVMGLNFMDDVRARMWKRQIEIGYEQDGGFLKASYAMKQYTPYVTLQRYVHSMQVNASVNLNLNKIWRAANGDPKAMELLRRYMPELLEEGVPHLERFKQIAGGSRRNLKELNLSGLPDDTLDAILDGVTRAMDAGILKGRPGWGGSYSYGPVGQVLGQFTGYMNTAHNVITRSTYENGGVLGIATILAHQYPLMFMTTYLNEIRKGNSPDLNDPDDLAAIAAQALNYSAVVGLYGELGNLLTKDGTSRGVAAMAPLGGFSDVVQAGGAIFDGDANAAGAHSLAALRKFTIMGALPGAQALEKIMKEEID